MFSLFVSLFIVYPFGNGRCGIRTHDRIAPIQHFQCCSFNRSDNLPKAQRGACTLYLTRRYQRVKSSSHNELRKAGNGIRTREESLENSHVAATSYPRRALFTECAPLCRLLVDGHHLSTADLGRKRVPCANNGGDHEGRAIPSERQQGKGDQKRTVDSDLAEKAGQLVATTGHRTHTLILIAHLVSPYVRTKTGSKQTRR
jgi:hypothetical protein